MKFLVTGGAGFIGSNYMHYVVNKYKEDYFVCLDALTYAGNYNNIKDLEGKDNFKFVKGDITDRDFIDKLFAEEKFDTVINFAAESHVDNSIKNPGIFLTTNIIGTQVLMDASLKYNVDRYHQVSTDEVYGDLPLDRPDLKFTEETPIHTSSPYSSSKAGADLLVGAYHRTFGLKTTISRCSNNYGPYQFPEKLIPVVISKALRNEKIPVYGTGENVRDWIHVIDHNIGGYTTQYNHLKDIYVKEGLTVQRGQQIATVGNTGWVDPLPTASNPLAGAHLHFEVRRYGNHINPFSLFR